MLGDRAGIAAFVAPSVKGHFMASLVHLTSHNPKKLSPTRGLQIDEELVGKGTDPSA